MDNIDISKLSEEELKEILKLFEEIDNKAKQKEEELENE